MLKYAVMKTKKTVTTLQPLVKLGLSHDDVACYIELVHRGSLRASELAQAVNIFPNAVYRIIDRLKQKGFVVVLDTHPVTFQAIPPQVAINAFVQRQAQALEEVKTLSIQAFARKTSSPQITYWLGTGFRIILISPLINKTSRPYSRGFFIFQASHIQVLRHSVALRHFYFILFCLSLFFYNIDIYSYFVFWSLFSRPERFIP